MSAKKFVKSFILLFLSVCLLIMGIVYIADPLFQYHDPWLTKTPYLYNSVYQAPGLARNTTYDSVLLGTSMTENFQTDWFDEELGWDTVKLTYSGARTTDLHALLGQVFNSKNEIKHIFMNIDIYQLEVDYTSAYVERPEYLYTDTVFDDFPYLLNKDILSTSAKFFTNVLAQNNAGNMSNAYTWSAEDGVDISAEAVLRDCVVTNSSFDPSVPQKSEEEYYENAKRNLENITWFIKEHPETEFNIFLSPYSVMFWETCMLSGSFDTQLKLCERLMGELLQYPNVKVFYFQNCEEIITDLSVYRDSIHYDANVNRYIFDCFKADKKQVFPDTLQAEVEKTRKITTSFNYQQVWDNYYNGVPIQ